jgi:Flp pilus assembly protein TadB
MDENLKSILILVLVVALVWILLAWLTTGFVATVVAILVAIGMLLNDAGGFRSRRRRL